jgi:ATP-binding cassette subfamily B multidrug efflux pump
VGDAYGIVHLKFLLGRDKMGIIKTLARSLREYKRESILSPVFVTCETLMECLIPLMMAKLIDETDGTTMQPILKYGAILFVLAMASLFFGTNAAKFAATGSAGLSKNLRHDIFYKVQTFAFSDIDRFSPSSLVTRITTDVTNVQNAYQMIIRGAIRAPLMMIFSVIMAMTIDKRMAVIFLVLLPILIVIIFSIVMKSVPLFRRIFKRYDAMNNDVQENITGIRVVKSFVREDYETNKFHAQSDQVCKDFTFAERIMALISPSMMLAVYSAISLVSYIGAKTIIQTKGVELTTGDLSSLIAYGVQIMMAVMIVSMVFALCSIASESAERIAEVLNSGVSLTSPENGITEVKDGSIDFDHVNFGYSENKNVLTDINLKIPSGSSLGIIGGTGSSKSSLVQLISRLYDVTSGNVKVGGTDVREYDLTALREQVATVLQKNTLFHGTINDNMRWGRKDATDEEIKQACELAQADEFIQQLPHKYEYMISQGGTNVSGGQKQRLCIARALLKRPKILIMDDSTSAVDTKTDALIRESMRKFMPDMTKIVIAQRVSSVEDCDNILVMDGGKIVEQGTSEKLLASGGIYKELYETQLKGKEA